jgi:hypothetical protein
LSYKPLAFIGEKITPIYDVALVFHKRPSCPNGFCWRGDNYRIQELLEEWVDFTRHGRMARNMSDEHAAAASTRGSWGVGRYHFHVKIEDGRIFHIYYDRAPRDVDDRMGEWFLVSELSPV